MIWKSEKAVGLGMSDDITEVVLQNERKGLEIDFAVDNVAKAVKQISNAGGVIATEPFDIPIGKCAIVKDPWDNTYVILDLSKGTFITDKDGNIIGHKQ